MLQHASRTQSARIQRDEAQAGKTDLEGNHLDAELGLVLGDELLRVVPE